MLGCSVEFRYNKKTICKCIDKRCEQNEILAELVRDAAVELESAPDGVWSDMLDGIASNISMDKAEMLIDEKLVPLQRELSVDLSTISHH